MDNQQVSSEQEKLQRLSHNGSTSQAIGGGSRGYPTYTICITGSDIVYARIRKVEVINVSEMAL
ncbi:hypothetical protein SDC9_148703 [bioreactor metagenome]|jgi:hypothetical protein|uniref:Uncharacterized protein n=2 Tax=root TaxID=1 RepID=R9C5D4_9CLOT|nr:hypothetical protein A500_12869 [Clostridium sartagoforme AAU1]KLE14783.1 hypothetical protein AAT22_14970 [Clostridium sp. C8]